MWDLEIPADYDFLEELLSLAFTSGVRSLKSYIFVF